MFCPVHHMHSAVEDTELASADGKISPSFMNFI